MRMVAGHTRRGDLRMDEWGGLEEVMYQVLLQHPRHSLVGRQKYFDAQSHLRER